MVDRRPPIDNNNASEGVIYGYLQVEETDPVKTENRYCTACLKTTKHAVKGA